MLMRFFLRFDFIPLVSGEGWGFLVWVRGVTGSREPRGVCTERGGSRLMKIMSGNLIKEICILNFFCFFGFMR